MLKIAVLRLALTNSFVIEEEKHLVPAVEDLRHPERAADRSNKLVALEGSDRSGGIEKVLGVEVGVAEKFEQRSVEFVRSSAGRHVDLAESAAIFGTVGSALHFELPQRVHRGQKKIRVKVWIGVLHAVELVVIV